MKRRSAVYLWVAPSGSRSCEVGTLEEARQGVTVHLGAASTQCHFLVKRAACRISAATTGEGRPWLDRSVARPARRSEEARRFGLDLAADGAFPRSALSPRRSLCQRRSDWVRASRGWRRRPAGRHERWAAGGDLAYPVGTGLSTAAICPRIGVSETGGWRGTGAATDELSASHLRLLPRRPAWEWTCVDRKERVLTAPVRVHDPQLDPSASSAAEQDLPPVWRP